MSISTSDSKGLHLSDLVVKGFRGIDDLTVSRLGRVNLISGKNSVGKTSLLDAVRVYAARGRYQALFSILRAHEELKAVLDEDGDKVSAPDLESLFNGRRFSPGDRIAIGPTRERDQLTIEPVQVTGEEAISLYGFLDESFLDEDLWAFRIAFQGMKQEIPINNVGGRMRSLAQRRFFSTRNSELPSGILCESLGPGLPSNADMARFWDSVALTDDENLAIHALNLIFGDDIERIAMVGDDVAPRSALRRAVVKMRGEERPAPLKSLGDGAARLFGVALALANSKDGFLVIDEVENGIHYSLQFDFWEMVMKAAHENNVQVFATTHSMDCVRGFARVAEQTEDVEGFLVRLQRKNGRLWSAEYNEDDLKVVSEQGIEVR